MSSQQKNSFSQLAPIYRPREKMKLLGASNLSLAELIAILLQTGSSKRSVLDLAKIVTKQGLMNLIQMSEAEICEYQGIGFSKASSLLAAFELAKRYKSESQLISLDKPSKIFYQVFDIKSRKQEICQALYVNGSQQLLHKKILSVGSLNQNYLEFRELLEPAITLPASGLFLVHNHPSGNCQPSQQDIEVTKQVANGCRLLGIELLDHIIVSNDNYLSMKQEGYLT